MVTEFFRWMDMKLSEICIKQSDHVNTTRDHEKVFERLDIKKKSRNLISIVLEVLYLSNHTYEVLKNGYEVLRTKPYIHGLGGIICKNKR